MTISLERLLKHMAWANQKTIEHLMTLPPEAIQAFATNPEWKVAEIIRHIVASGNFYVYRITGSAPTDRNENEILPVTAKDLDSLAKRALLVDQALLDCEKLEDIQVEFLNHEKKVVRRLRSTILSQSVHHATEHRAQIASALEAKGFTSVDLDELDLWSFESDQG
ncbi:MAG: DinB family protein [Acidobacteria bacterium]|nr:DinB family protein [Acidobacteriota bacterium]